MVDWIMQLGYDFDSIGRGRAMSSFGAGVIDGTIATEFTGEHRSPGR